jgi:hypothetical protein
MIPIKFSDYKFRFGELWELDDVFKQSGIYLILEDSDGEIIGNQTQGVMCCHPSTWGFLYKLANNDLSFDCFNPEKWYNFDLNFETLGNQMLDALNLIKPEEIDRFEILDIKEAWTKVKIYWCTGKTSNGVISWENCD